MIAAGYMYKTVATAPDWLGNDTVVDIFSLSGCVSEYFADYINFWKHNGFWLFNAPTDIESIASDEGIDLSTMTLFFYEVFENQYNIEFKKWEPFETEAFSNNVLIPAVKSLRGFDVVSFSVQSLPECSPLSCNSLADSIPVNEHCLLKTFEEAKQSLEIGLFDNSEAGPFRIFAVYAVPSTYTHDSRSPN